MKIKFVLFKLLQLKLFELKVLVNWKKDKNFFCKKKKINLKVDLI